MKKYVFFWQGNSPFSNWYPSPFNFEGVEFNCAEQYMMYQKAKFFNDTYIMEQVLKTSSPKEQKALGRQVKNFNADRWSANCLSIMEKGLVEKFIQNEKIYNYLKSFEKDSIFVEASPFDRIWGIGYNERDALNNIENWGQNLLGNLITKINKII